MAPARSSLPTAALSFLILSSASFFGAEAATVTGLQPTRGSVMGGTYLTVWGAGFNRNGRDGKTIV